MLLYKTCSGIQWWDLVWFAQCTSIHSSDVHMNMLTHSLLDWNVEWFEWRGVTPLVGSSAPRTEAANFIVNLSWHEKIQHYYELSRLLYVPTDWLNCNNNQVFLVVNYWPRWPTISVVLSKLSKVMVLTYHKSSLLIFSAANLQDIHLHCECLADNLLITKIKYLISFYLSFVARPSASKGSIREFERGRIRLFESLKITKFCFRMSYIW